MPLRSRRLPALAPLLLVLAACGSITPGNSPGKEVLKPTPPEAVQAAIDALAQAATPPAAPEGELLLQVLGPTEAQRQTSRASVHIAARTSRGHTAFIGGEAVPVSYSGLFARDQIALVEGKNQIEIRVQSPSGQSRRTVLEIERQAPSPTSTAAQVTADWDPASLQPRGHWVLRSQESLSLKLRARSGSRPSVQIGDGDWQVLQAYPAADGELAWFGAELVAPTAARVQVQGQGETLPVRLRFEASAPTSPASPATQLLPLTLGYWSAARPYVVGEGGSELTWGLHEVRLGGPNLAELPAGTRVMVDGQRGEHLRVRLSSDFEAWAPAKSLSPLKESSPPNAFSLGNLMLIGAPDGDTLSIPWNPRVPYAVRQQRGADGRPVIELEFFGGHLAATWLTQRRDPQVVEAVHVEQTQRERTLVRLTLRGKGLWGYQVIPAGDVLQLTVRPAPVLNPAPGQPLRGLRIALEAGHGGPSNLGAVGLTGSREKDVNLATTWLLQQELERAGAQVFMVRQGEENPSGTERARLAVASGAQLFISIHANSAGHDRGYMRGQGASVFYKHEHGRLLSRDIYRRFRQATGLPEFGLVGNFNYAPIRLNTAMPAVLVELAFMSNPYEEAQMLDPSFRQTMARAIRDGISEFVCQSLGREGRQAECAALASGLTP